MPISPDLMRTLLLFCLVGMSLLAAFYLRGRELPLSAYLRWGLLILCVPLIGPFLAILSAPGLPRRRQTC